MSGWLATARARVRTPGTTAVLAGSFASGLGAYAFQVLGTRALGDAAYAPISVLWTIQYLALTIALVSVEAYVTRAVTLHADEPDVVRRGELVMSAWIGCVVVAVGAAAWVWRDALFHGRGADLPLVAALIVAGYGAFVVIRGRLAGEYRFRHYGIATAMESLSRVLIAVPVVVLGATTRSLAWTLPLGPIVVAGWWLLVRDRPYVGPTRAPDPEGLAAMSASPTGRYLLATTVANASSQTLLAAGPLVLIPLGATPAEISVFFVTTTAARVPLVFAFGGLLSRVLPPLTRVARAGDFRRLRRLALLTTAGAVAVGVAGAGAGAAIGPAIVALFFGADFEPSAGFVALTVAGVVMATAALGLNQLLIAMGQELRMIGPWVAALAAGGAAVALGGGEEMLRVAVAFVIGEAVAITGLVAAVLTARPRTPAAVLPTTDVPPVSTFGE